MIEPGSESGEGVDEDQPVAVVDIGSGSVKLLITGRAGLTTIGAERVMTGVKTRLVDGADHITERSLAETAGAFSGFAELIAEHAPSTVSVVGTAAARTAGNVERLATIVQETFGVPLEVLAGDREAELSFNGAVAGRGIDGPVAVMDVGGGSTEFAARGDDGKLQTVSLSVGAGTLTDLYLTSDPHRPAELSSALSVMAVYLDDLRRELPDILEILEDGTLFGVGAMSQIAAVEVGSQDPHYVVDGYELTKPNLEEVFRALATESAEERTFNPGLKPHHAYDIVGAMCVAVEFMRQFSVPDMLISERGLMHGLAADLLAKR